MAVSAAIVINQTGKPSGSPSVSRDDLDLSVLVNLSNNNNAGVTTWLWEMISKPPGSSSVLDTPSSSTCSFVPDVIGSYLIRLSVNGTIITDQRIAAVKTQNLGIRIPAAEETDEFGTTQGWAAALYQAFSILDAYSGGNKVKVSVSDVISDYLQNKTEPGLNIDLTKVGTGDEKLNISTTEHLGLPTQTSDPTLLDNYGSLYSKNVDGYTELFYLDNYGSPVQITRAGCLYGTGIIANDELNSTGTETYIELTYLPLSIEYTSSGNDLAVYRNGVLMKYVASLGSDVNEWTYNESLNRVEFVASGEVDWYSVAYITRRFCNSGGGGSLTIQSEGTTIESTASILNFIGVGISVESAIVGSKVNIYVPPPTYAPYFNVGAATVSDISTYSRYVAAPTTEGTPFKIGDWTAGTLHACTNTGSWVYSTGAACSFKTDTTTLEVTVLDADGITPIASHLTSAITGNIDVTVDNIRIQVTSFQTDGSRFKAVVTVTINIAAILLNSGRCSISIVHQNDGTDYSKLQNDIFYDSNPNAATITGGTVSIVENSAVTKFISGVEYYSAGSTFSVAVSDIDNINCNSYPSTVLNVEASLFALSTLNVSASGLTGWTNACDNINSSYSNLVWTISTPNIFTMSNSGIARARAIDWVAGSYLNSTTFNLLVDTYSTASTRLLEGFRDESWRCALMGDFDLPDQKGWDSTSDVGSGDAVFINGGCERNVTDFSIFNPNSGAQPDYSGADSTVYLIREFNHNGDASSGFSLNISGVYTSLEMKLGAAWDGTENGGTVFVDMLSSFNYSDWNNGNPLSGTGCWTGDNHYTFGSNNIINCGNTLYIKISFTGTQRIDELGVVFD